MFKIILSIFFIIISFSTYSTKPIVLINAETPTKIKVKYAEFGEVTYRVTNPTQKTLSIILKPHKGITQSITSPGDCALISSLKPGAHCRLRLKYNTSSISRNPVIGGPWIHKVRQDANGSAEPDPFFAAQPQESEQLNITVSPVYAFITNYANFKVSTCLVNPNNGSLSLCRNQVLSTESNYLYGISISNDYAYITTTVVGASSSIILSCKIKPNRILTDCSNISSPLGTLISSSVFNNYFYSVNNTKANVTSCEISSGGGDFVSCGTTGSSLSDPLAGIAFYTSGSTTYAYITNDGTANVTKCELLTDGTFSNCSILSGTTFVYPAGIVINNNYAYIIDSSSIQVCSLTSSGTFSVCSSFSDATITSPTGLGVYNNNLYINNIYANSVTNCSINSDDGSLSSCNKNSPIQSDGTSVFDAPISNIAFSD